MTAATPPIPTLAILEYHVRDEHHGREWPHRAYRVRLTHDGRSIEVPWRQGMGINTDPEAHDVIGALLMDAQGIGACTGFPDWAESYGLNPDSITDRNTYTQAREQTDALARLLTRRVMVALMDDENATYGAAPRFALAWVAAFARVSA
jgi:hypothetical protein